MSTKIFYKMSALSHTFRVKKLLNENDFFTGYLTFLIFIVRAFRESLFRPVFHKTFYFTTCCCLPNGRNNVSENLKKSETLSSDTSTWISRKWYENLSRSKPIGLRAIVRIFDETTLSESRRRYSRTGLQHAFRVSRLAPLFLDDSETDHERCDIPRYYRTHKEKLLARRNRLKVFEFSVYDASWR